MDRAQKQLRAGPDPLSARRIPSGTIAQAAAEQTHTINCANGSYLMIKCLDYITGSDG